MYTSDTQTSYFRVFTLTIHFPVFVNIITTYNGLMNDTFNIDEYEGVLVIQIKECYNGWLRIDWKLQTVRLSTFYTGDSYYMIRIILTQLVENLYSFGKHKGKTIERRVSKTSENPRKGTIKHLPEITHPSNRETLYTTVKQFSKQNTKNKLYVFKSIYASV